MLDELVDWLEMLEAELLELLVEMLDELDEDEDDNELLEELDISSICMIDRRPLDRPGNSKSPVWKFSTSGSLSTPPVDVSTKVAWNIVFSDSVCVDEVAVPARTSTTSGVGAESSPARYMRVIVKSRLLKLTALPRPKVTRRVIAMLQ